jgi:hypothetical protein
MHAKQAMQRANSDLNFDYSAITSIRVQKFQPYSGI